MGRARILPGQDTRSRGVSRRIDERITGYTQSAGFEGCIESWMCASVRARAHAHAGLRALHARGPITEAGKKPSRKSRGRLIRPYVVWQPHIVSYRKIERIDCFFELLLSRSSRDDVSNFICNFLSLLHLPFRAVSNRFSELFDASLSSLNNLNSLVLWMVVLKKRKSRFERCRCQPRIEVFINFLNFLS